jgi:large subunit ribosomal protein L15
MVTNKAKKVTKYRSHTTHGGGHRKKRRGAGSRGGRGNAGTGKRAGQKKAGISRKLGKHGFTSKSRTKVRSINVSYFTEKVVEKLVANNKVKKEGESYIINLADLGYQKLLGTGQTKLKLKLSVAKFTARAEEKVKSAGGEIVSGVVEETKSATENKTQS